MSNRAAAFSLAMVLVVVGCSDGDGGLGGAGKGLAGGDLDREPTPEPDPTTTTAAPTTTTAPTTTAPPSTVHSGPPGAFGFTKPGIINCTLGRPTTTCQPSSFTNVVSAPFILEWNAAAGATAYSLEMVAQNGNKLPLGAVPSRSFRIEVQHVGSCRNPCSWTYVVSATNADGFSETRLQGLKVS